MQRTEFVAEKQQAITSVHYATHLPLYFYAHKPSLTRLETHESAAISTKIFFIKDPRGNEFPTVLTNETFTCHFIFLSLLKLRSNIKKIPAIFKKTVQIY